MYVFDPIFALECLGRFIFDYTDAFVLHVPLNECSHFRIEIGKDLISLFNNRYPRSGNSQCVCNFNTYEATAEDNYVSCNIVFYGKLYVFRIVDVTNLKDIQKLNTLNIRNRRGATRCKNQCVIGDGVGTIIHEIPILYSFIFCVNVCNL